MTANNFKQRYNNHRRAFRDEKYSNETELSKHVKKDGSEKEAKIK